MENIKLQEIDWKNARDAVISELRRNKMGVIMNEKLLEQIEVELELFNMPDSKIID